jgi:formylglycine-generating enzyme required for sulfatase activity
MNARFGRLGRTIIVSDFLPLERFIAAWIFQLSGVSFTIVGKRRAHGRSVTAKAGMNEIPTKVFISYSHDGPEHEERVLDLADRLREDGIDAEIDQYEPAPREGWPMWCERQIKKADYVLLVCTDTYMRRVNGEEEPGRGHGVLWEARIIHQLLYDAGSVGDKFIPVQFSNGSADHIPTLMRGATRYVVDTDPGYEGLYRQVTNQPSIIRPQLGKRKALPPKQSGAEAKAAIRLPHFAVFRDIEAPWCPEMVALPAGEFLMGSPESEVGRGDDEGPQHRVTISSRFAIGRYPVTFDEYDHFCDVTNGEKPEDEGWGRGRRPAINVSWYDAQAYCKWLAKVTDRPYRLPSETEWEYACRAGTTRPFSFGRTTTEKDANFGWNVGKTTKVGTFPPNPWGLYEMHGNVLEWVADNWHESYDGAPADGSVWVTAFAGAGAGHVLRGGSWNSGARTVRHHNARYVRSAYRDWLEPGGRYDGLGFRCARDQS